MHEFESHLSGDKPVVVEFAASWCVPCTLMIPVLKEVREKAGDRASVITIDIDKDPHFARRYDVYSVPTVIIFHDGEILWRKNGLATSNEVLHHLNLCIT